MRANMDTRGGLAAAGIAAAVACGVPACDGARAGDGAPALRLVLDGPCEEARDICPESVLEEPSGVVFHPERGTLFAVGDEGDVVELTLEGKRLQAKRPGGDLEGITVGPRGRLIVAQEDPPALLFLDPATLAVERRVKVAPMLAGEKAICVTRGAGIEGVAWAPSLRKLFVANQFGPARILEVEVPDGPGEARIVRVVAELEASVECCSDLYWDEAAQRFLVTAASFARPGGKGYRRGRLWEVSLAGEAGRARDLPGSAQEGVCVDAAGAAYVACDTGGILKVEAAREMR